MDSKERIAKGLAVATDTKVFEMEAGAYKLAPKVFVDCFPNRKAVIVADLNTWRVLGESVYEAFCENNIPTQKYIIDKKEFHADWKYVEMTDKVLEGDFQAAKAIEEDSEHVEGNAEEAFKAYSEDNFVLVSVGSGVINDLCKLSSHHYAQSYLTLPTAASVDGYTSFGASITYQGAKQTFSCPAPVAVVADLDVIAAAPKEMTAAGYADLAAKIPAGGEWMIADFVESEPIKPDAWHVLQDYIDDFLSDPQGVASGDKEAIAGLFEGLVLSGFAMQAAQSSRPASCCDHLFSHILDMTGHRFHGKLQSHGFQVAIGTLTMCAVFDELFKLDLTDIDVDACVAAWPDLASEQQRALDIFQGFPSPKLGYNEITRKYEGAEKVREELIKLRTQWPELKEKLRSQVYSFEKMQALFKACGAPSDPTDIGVTRSQIKEMFPKVQLMRFRFNLLDLARRGAFYNDIVEPVFAPGGAWEIKD